MKDERTRFNLAIECGNIEVALQSAQVRPSAAFYAACTQISRYGGLSSCPSCQMRNRKTKASRPARRQGVSDAKAMVEN